MGRGSSLHKAEHRCIYEIMDDLGVSEDIGKRMALAAMLGEQYHGKVDQVCIPYEDLQDLVINELKVIDVLKSWPHHIRESLERYQIEWFHEEKNCNLWFYNYKLFYNKVQKLAMEETGVKFI